MGTVQSRFAKMQDFAATAMAERFAVLQYDRTVDKLAVWKWSAILTMLLFDIIH
jgi:hypothetical protein